MPTAKPENVLHFRQLQEPDTATYPNDPEKLGLKANFAKALRLYRLGVSHLVLPPGRRSSWPHAEESEEEFVYVLEGTPDLWQDGHLWRLQPGDGVGWPSATGVAHTIINNTDADVRLLVVGEPGRLRYRVHYPLHPARNAALGEEHWAAAPARPLGPHDGLPDALRGKSGE